MPDVTPSRPPGGPGTIFIFDGYNFIFRAFHAIPMLNAPDGRPTNAVQGFARMVQAARRDFAPERIVAIFDAGGDGGRRAAFADYKAQRPPAPDDLIPQFAMVREATDALGIPRVEHPEYEADDLIAAYTNAARAEGMTVTIVSGDKDLMQLVTLGDAGGPPVVLYDTMKDKVIGPAEVEAKFGVRPEKLGDLLALTGDSSDNVPGVPGIGPKTAAALLIEYGDLEGVLAAAPTIKQKKRRERLIEHADNARMSRGLVELRDDVPLPLPLADLVDRGADEATLVGYFEPLGFKQLLREAGSTLRGSGATTASRAAGGQAAGGQAVGGEDPGPLELCRVPGFAVQADAYQTLCVGDEAAVEALVATLHTASLFAVQVVTAAPGRGSTEATLGARPAGLAVAAAGIPPTYLPFAHHQTDLVDGRQLTQAYVLERLGPLLADADRPKAVHAHKAAAHGLANAGVELRGVVVDPLLASYTLDPARASHELDALSQDVLGHVIADTAKLTGSGKKFRALPELSPAEVGAWACERAEVTLAVALALQAQLSEATPATRKLLDEVEMPLADVLARIERRGIAVDVDALREQSEELATKIFALQDELAQAAGHAINLDSPLQLQKLLFDDWELPPTRKIKTGYSTDATALESLTLYDPRVKLVLEYRSLSKLKNTYLDALPKLVREQSRRLHTIFHQAVAATGRLSSQDPNLQNIPIRTAEGRRIREAFIAPPGRELVTIDYSQIELRVLAHLSGDPNLMSAFIEGVDVHRRTAAEVFGIHEDEVDSEQRRIAKAVNFGVVYGQTAHGLAQQLGIPRGKAGSYIRAYFEKIPGVDRYMRELIETAKQRGYAETILGRRRRIPELARKGAARSHGERIARNTPIQGSAADILKVAMIAVDAALTNVDWATMLLTVHDELIFECEQDRVEELVELCSPLMVSAAHLSVPLAVDAGHGRTWGACKG